MGGTLKLVLFYPLPWAGTLPTSLLVAQSAVQLGLGHLQGWGTPSSLSSFSSLKLGLGGKGSLMAPGLWDCTQDQGDPTVGPSWMDPARPEFGLWWWRHLEQQKGAAGIFGNGVCKPSVTAQSHGATRSIPMA